MSSSMPLQPSWITFEHFHIDQRGEDDGLFALHLAGVVDLAHHLVGLVHRVDEGQAHMARLEFKLGQDGVAEASPQ